MTDPVTNVEIEDVLSSIRRLVSDDARVVKPQPKAVKAPDRLVLTPALRVSGEDAEEGPIQAEAEAIDPAKPELEAPGDVESQEDASDPILLTDLAPLVEEATPDPESVENSDDFSQNDIEDVSFEHAADVIDAVEDSLADEKADEAEPAEEEEAVFTPDTVADQPEATDVVDQDESDTTKTETDETDADDAEELTSNLLSQLVEEEVEQALGAVDIDLDESADPEKANEVTGADDTDQVDASQDSQEKATTQEDEAVAALIEAEVESEPLVEESLESKIAALEELVGRSHEEEWEPEQSEPDAAVFHRSSDVLEWQDHLPGAAEQIDAMADETVTGDQPAMETADVGEPDTNAGVGDAVTIDEETLRGLVSEIVRQELQGALGERITRNVRKLVRREIHRVLMSQDFD